MTHPIIEDLLWRHSTKRYDASRKVSKEDLEVIFEAIRLSASSINSQPWKFIVLESEEARQRLHNTYVDKFMNNQPHALESSQVILFAYNPRYTRDDFSNVVDQYIKDQRIPSEKRDSALASYIFAELNTAETGDNSGWTKAQTYLALGNTLHTLARLRIDSTPIEGIDTKAVNDAFKEELDGYQCDVALAIGYRHPTDDYNAKLPKSRHELNQILKII